MGQAAHLAANDDVAAMVQQRAFGLQQLAEALECALVGEGEFHGDAAAADWKLNQQALNEQVYGRYRVDNGAAGVKVETLLQGVDVDDEDVDGAAAAGGDGGEEHGHGVGGGNLALNLHALHCASGVVPAAA